MSTEEEQRRVFQLMLAEAHAPELEVLSERTATPRSRCPPPQTLNPPKP